jgi:glycerol-3-phosphate O-acyltransferase
MAGLPLRRAGSPRRWFATPVVHPPGVDLGARPRPRIYLAPVASAADRRILCASLQAAGLPVPVWIPTRRRRTDERRLRESFLAGDPVLVPLVPPRRGPERLARLLAWAREAGCDADVIPIEVLWGPAAGRAPSMWNLVLGSPYEPPEWRRWLRVRLRDRVRVIAGPPGTLSALRGECGHTEDALALSSYVRGQATKALSLVQRQVMGDRYKVPILVAEGILRDPAFQDRVAAAGAAKGSTRSESLRAGERALRELATRHDPWAMELFRRFVRWLYTKVYDEEIVCDAAALEQLRQLARRAPLVFIPSHKSNFDHLCLYSLLHENGFPPPHTAAGNNMAFFPMNLLLPRTGAYFIRRAFNDDPIYKECMRSFVAYMVRNRFNQEFFIEGGRSRSGKQLPPRYGMLNYVVEAHRGGAADDVCFVPVAIAYDQLLEVDDYVREQLGEEKSAESFAFLVRMIRRLSRRDLGRVYMRFAPPISLRRHVERSGGDPLVVEKLAFQVANAINAATPLTAVAAVCSSLVGAGRRALTGSELESEVGRLAEFAVERGISLGRELEQGPKVAVRAATEALRQSGVLERYDGGVEPVHYVSTGRRHTASYYRNTTVHYFLPHAIASLARKAARQERKVEDWALRMRELLKFEFFFSEREPFLQEIAREVEGIEREEAAGLVPLLAASPRIVLDYLESYWVVTRALRALGPSGGAVREKELLTQCLAIGRQLLLQAEVDAPELLSRVNFKNALRLAQNLGAARIGEDGYAPGETRALDAMARDLELLARVARA